MTGPCRDELFGEGDALSRFDDLHDNPIQLVIELSSFNPRRNLKYHAVEAALPFDLFRFALGGVF